MLDIFAVFKAIKELLILLQEGQLKQAEKDEKRICQCETKK